MHEVYKEEGMARSKAAAVENDARYDEYYDQFGQMIVDWVKYKEEYYASNSRIVEGLREKIFPFPQYL